LSELFPEATENSAQANTALALAFFFALWHFHPPAQKRWDSVIHTTHPHSVSVYHIRRGKGDSAYFYATKKGAARFA
jgi:hypothetical protein